jgi:regulatory protein
MPRPKQPKAPPAAITRESLAKAALSYLNRRDASRNKLRSHLRSWTAKHAPAEQREAVQAWIDELLLRYQASNLIDDERLANNAVRSLRARGKSARAISYKLSAQGLDHSSIDAALSAERGENADSELQAAKALVQKRKLGMFRPEPERSEKHRKDLAVLARAGFDFDTCRKALGAGAVGDDEF